MALGNILGQILQEGMGGRQVSRTRADTLARNMSAQGGGSLDAIFGQLQRSLGGGAGAAGGAGGALGGMAEMAKDFLRKDQVGGMSGAQVGGIGALAGAILGGGAGGAVRGGALAVIGTLALNALKAAQARAAEGQAAAGGGPDGATIALEPAEIAEATSPEAEKLILRAMIAAAKADGAIDQAEMAKIVGKIGADGVTDEEKAFVMAELAAPVDVAGLAAAVRGPAQAAEVYAASLLAIEIDSEAERAYLRQLAQALRLDPATVAELHRMTGAPAA